MRKLIVNEWMTLDGVVQAPSTVDEDTTGGFDRGGWHPRYFDDVALNDLAVRLIKSEHPQHAIFRNGLAIVIEQRFVAS